MVENGIQFKALQLEHQLVFEFDEEVENSAAYEIMIKLSDELRGFHIKTALYFVERKDKISHLIY